MIQKLKIAVLSLSLLFVGAVPLAAPATVGAQQIQNNLCRGADDLQITTDNSGANCVLDNPSAGACDFNCVLRKVVNIISVIVGVIAVIMIIYGGFRYVTSGGKQESVTTAKNTLLYAIIGLVIVALAQVIVRFVLQQSTTAS